MFMCFDKDLKMPLKITATSLSCRCSDLSLKSVRLFFKPIGSNLFKYKAIVEMELMYHAPI